MTKTNKKKYIRKTLSLACLFIFSFSIASSVSAQALVPCGLNGAADCTLCHLVLGFQSIYDYLWKVLILPAAILVIIVAGVIYMVSSGNKGLIEKAKSALLYALTAVVLTLIAWLIINSTLYALGYSKAGSWYTFTCDTTQTQGPTGGTGGGTLPANPGGTGGGAAQAGSGTCGGVAGQTEACKYLTKDLENLMACIKGKVGGTAYNNTGGTNFFGSTAFAAGAMRAGYLQNMSDLQSCAGSNWSSGRCNHRQNSCHYGGTNCPGQINAADFEGGDFNAIRQATTACGGFAIYQGTNYRADGSTSTASDHTTHVHVSPMNGCGCQ